jgi:hypothetical protein
VTFYYLGDGAVPGFFFRKTRETQLHARDAKLEGESPSVEDGHQLTFGRHAPEGLQPKLVGPSRHNPFIPTPPLASIFAYQTSVFLVI